MWKTTPKDKTGYLNKIQKKFEQADIVFGLSEERESITLDPIDNR